MTGRRPSLWLRFIIMLVLVAALLGGLVWFNLFKDRMIHQFMGGQSEPVATVTAATVASQDWNPGIAAVGSLRAVRAVDLSSEVAGLVRRVGFVSGQGVVAGQRLIELNDDVERAQLRSLETAHQLARQTLERDRQLLAIQAATAAQLESDEADLRAKAAQVEAQRALVDKKTLVAPFAGRIGISTVAPGQYVNPGDHLANVQDLDRLVIDFAVPQGLAPQARLRAPVELRIDAWPERVFAGEVSAINATVDTDTRNLQVEARVQNPRHQLLPGMFAHVTLLSTRPQTLVTVPQTAVAFNPYGAMVYLVKEAKGADGKVLLSAQQVVVKTGATRGDQVAILQGLKAGDRVVTSGQLKLHNGTPLVIDNSVVPANDPDPHPQDL
ncbi:MAG: efflux RND transporter periplasmic adaptor subunit [Pseudomonadota bacterium]|nr:efflux RND transporter periplasmic adaptor subunit [Pseudomonadota bacterium]